MAYAVLTKRRKLLNPGKRKRKMSAKQIAIFGTKRQKAGLRASRRRRSNPKVGSGSIRRYKKAYKKAKARSITGTGWFTKGPAQIKEYKSRKKRKRNVGSILVATIPGMNPERKRGSMARTRKRRRKAATKVVHHRRRRRMSSRRSNPGRRRRRAVTVKYRYRGRSRRHSNRGRRRNPGMFGGEERPVIGILAGVAATRLITGFAGGMLPAAIPPFVSTGIVAVLQGKFLKKWFGDYAMYGGLALAFAQAINQFVPSLGGYIGLSGMGAVVNNGGFYNPQVNRWGSMGAFQLPNTVANAIALSGAKAGGMHGLGATNMSARRIGRIQ